MDFADIFIFFDNDSCRILQKIGILANICTISLTTLLRISAILFMVGVFPLMLKTYASYPR